MASSASPIFNDMEFIDAMDIDDIGDKYINMASCGIPTQPKNKDLVFPNYLLRDLLIINDPNNKAKKREKSLYIIEKWLVEQGSCTELNPSIVDELQERLFNISSDKIQEYLLDPTTLDAYVHDNLSCIVNAIYQRHNPTNPFESRIRERIKNWFPALKLIGAPSVNGYALETSFNSYSTQLFIVKVPRRGISDMLIHEAAIGLYVTNKMRHLLPNFMYVYGYTQCAPPVLDNNNDVLTWCTSDTERVSYLITENIIGAQDFGEFLKDKNVNYRDFQLIFLQIINALNQAFKKYKYTHNDLHYGNILIRKFSNKVAIPYYDSMNNIAGYIASQYIPTIIDYGYSGAQIGSQMIGRFGLAKSGIITTEAFPMYDMYKLVCFLYERVHISGDPTNNSVLAIKSFLKEAFDKFGEGSIIDRVKRRLNDPRADYYQAPEHLRGMTYDAYIKLLGPFLPLYLLTSVNEVALQNIYLPGYDSPVNSCDFYEAFNTQIGPTTPFEYCQAITTLKHNTLLDEDYQQQATQWLDSKFDAESYFLNKQVDIQKDIDDANVITNFLRNVIINQPTEQDLKMQFYSNSTRRKLVMMLRLREKIANMISMIRAVSCALIEQHTYNKYVQQLRQLLEVVDEWMRIFEQARLEVQQQKQSIKPIPLFVGNTNEYWFKEFYELADQLIAVDIDQLRVVPER